MPERESGGSAPWIAFLAGIVLVAVIGFGVFAYNGGLNTQDVAEMQIDMPDVKIDRPEIDLPEPPPAPQMPPSAEETPQTTAPSD
jgi:hypothetical protein